MKIEADQFNWRPLRQSDLTRAFVDEFYKEDPDLSVISAWFATKFADQTGFAVDRGNPEVDKLYAQWLARQERESEITFHIRKYPRLQQLVFGTYSSKVFSLSRRHCYICRPDGPIHVIPIRITPRSRQNIGTLDRRAFRAAIRQWSSSRLLSIDLSGRFCLAVTFVMDSHGRDKDLDNMIKILQDAIAEAFNFNDRNVHHLDLLKLIMPVQEEYVYIRVMNSRVNEECDVLAPIEHRSFGCGPPLKLDDFLMTKEL